VASCKRAPTERAHGLNPFLSGVKRLVEETLASSSVRMEDLLGIGIGLPGSIQPNRYVMTQGSIPFLKDLELRPEFQRLFSSSAPMVFENDANCFALAEARFGSGKDWARTHQVADQELCMIGITLGTGVGGGLIMNGRLIRGRRGGAGEIGHMSLRSADRPCYCGKSGCAEQFLSGPGVEHAYRLRSRSAVPVSGKQVFHRSRKADPFAVSTVESYREDLLQFLSNLSNLLDPHLMVLGGGISLEDQIYEDIESRLSEGCFLTRSPPAILKNSLGDAAGALGAAYLAFLSSKSAGASS
jgi:fructokinase